MVSGTALAHLRLFDGTQGFLHPVEPIEEVMQRIPEGWMLSKVIKPQPHSDAAIVLREDAQWKNAARAVTKAKRATDLADAAAKARHELGGTGWVIGGSKAQDSLSHGIGRLGTLTPKRCRRCVEWT